LAASPNTIAGYRDTFGLFLRFTADKTAKVPTKLKIEDIDATLVGDFLVHVENQRGNSARSRKWTRTSAKSRPFSHHVRYRRKASFYDQPIPAQTAASVSCAL
jgi:hypothetical protein